MLVHQAIRDKSSKLLENDLKMIDTFIERIVENIDQNDLELKLVLQGQINDRKMDENQFEELLNISNTLIFVHVIFLTVSKERKTNKWTKLDLTNWWLTSLFSFVPTTRMKKHRMRERFVCSGDIIIVNASLVFLMVKRDEFLIELRDIYIFDHHMFNRFRFWGQFLFK